MTARTCIDCGSPISTQSKGRCRPCSNARLNADPEIDAKRRANLAAWTAKPENQAKMRAGMARYIDNMPEADREARRQRGKRIYRDILNRPDVRAKSLSAEARAKAGAARTETVLGWCPPHLRAQYRQLVYTKTATAAEARRIIEDQVATEERRRLAALTPFERQLERVANGAKLVAKPTFRRPEHEFTLGGVAPEAM